MPKKLSRNKVHLHLSEPDGMKLFLNEVEICDVNGSEVEALLTALGEHLGFEVTCSTDEDEED